MILEMHEIRTHIDNFDEESLRRIVLDLLKLIELYTKIKVTANVEL